MFIKIPSVREHAEKSPFKKDFRDGLSYVTGSIDQARGLLPLIFLATALNFLIMPIATLPPYQIRFEHLGGGGKFEDLAKKALKN